VEVNPDNFDSVLEGMSLTWRFRWRTSSAKIRRRPDQGRPSLQEPGGFRAEQVARQVKPLKEMLDLRTKLSDLRGSLQGNDKLEELLLDAVGNTENWTS